MREAMLRRSRDVTSFNPAEPFDTSLSRKRHVAALTEFVRGRVVRAWSPFFLTFQFQQLAGSRHAVLRQMRICSQGRGIGPARLRRVILGSARDPSGGILRSGAPMTNRGRECRRHHRDHNYRHPLHHPFIISSSRPGAKVRSHRRVFM
jgi:hypothetical protein